MATSGNADMTVNDSTTYQTFTGFGGCFNEKGWDNLNQLSASDKNKALMLLFDPNEANLRLGRIPIGSNDYAMSDYTEDDTANDYQMANFSISRDQQYIIPYVKAAMAINPNMHFSAAPWTPPAWMKNNNADVGGEMTDNAQFLQALALYLAKWVQAYNAQGITIDAIHPQNEPNYDTYYASCLWPSALYDKFVGQYLGPTFSSMKINSQIWLGNMSNGKAGTDPAVVSAVTGDSTSMMYIKGFGLQYDMLQHAAQLSTMGLPVWQTEHQCGNYPWVTPFNMTQAPNDQAYAVETWGLIRNWIAAGVNAYQAWNMVLDTVGIGIASMGVWPQNALLTVDRNSKTLGITPAYYVFRHFSQFIQSGATRVGTTGSTVDALAFKNPDGTHVAIMYNSASSAVTTTFSLGGAKLRFSVPANGWATIKK
jgi:glucosylceramidase